MTYKERLFAKYEPQQAQRQWQDYLSRISQSKQGFIKRYGEEQGLSRYQTFKSKSVQTEANFIKRHGQQKGRVLWAQCIKKRNSKNPRTLGYWLKQLDGDVELAKEKLRQYQSHSMQWFLLRYGQEEGLLRYKLWQQHQKNSIQESYALHPEIAVNISNTVNQNISLLTDQQRKEMFSVKRCYIRRYGEVRGTELFKDLYKQRNTRSTRYSNMGLQFCVSVIDQLNGCTAYDEVQYGSNQRFLKSGDQMFFYDLYIKQGHQQIIVEFNGDFWHANPDIFSESYIHPVTVQTASEIWQRDATKLQLARDLGITVFVVWEKQYLAHKGNTVTRTVDNIMEKLNGRIG